MWRLHIEKWATGKTNKQTNKQNQGKPDFYVRIIISCNLHANIFKLKK